MAEFNQNLWAPWRMEYIHSLDEKEKGGSGCFLCDYAAQPERDQEHHVLWRTGRCFTCFNRFPYSNGHLLISPVVHVGALHQLPETVLLDAMCQLRDAQRLLAETTQAQGFNVGMNFGRCAGAGLPDHLHVHIVPRWEGDTNFMPVCADMRVIPQSIEALHNQMREAAVRLGLPALRD